MFTFLGVSPKSIKNSSNLHQVLTENVVCNYVPRRSSRVYKLATQLSGCCNAAPAILNFGGVLQNRFLRSLYYSLYSCCGSFT